MIRLFWAAWGGRILAAGAVALAGYLAVTRVQLADLRTDLTRANDALAIERGLHATCKANLAAAIIDKGNRDDAEDLTPDQLRDRLGRPEWMRP